jgi:hypothetical protein
MGFLDALLGKSKLPKPKPDRLFAISTAYVTLNTNQNTEIEIQELLAQSSRETSTRYNLKKDSYGYLWVILNDPDFEGLVSTLYMISETLAENDFGEQLLCAVFKFKNGSEVYWIYNFKKATFYPFVPKGKQRDSSYEFRLRSIMEKELPIEKEVERWYPLWDIPV